jgi:NADH:ubiquinone oxidoreductase subunit E
MGTACFVRHAQRLIETLEQTLGVALGDVTDDRMFSLQQVRCIGACGLAPAIMINDDTLGNLTPKELRKRVLKLRARALREAKKAASLETRVD